MYGSIGTAVSELWYSFDIPRSTSSRNSTYLVWCNDNLYGDDTKTESIQVSAYRSDGTVLFISAGWDMPGEIQSSDYTGTVYLKVVPINKGGSGSFAIGYSSPTATDPYSKTIGTSTRADFGHTPLTANQWMHGSIGALFSEVWYSFVVSSYNITCRVWCNDKMNGYGSKTANVQVSAYESDGTELFSSAGWDNPGVIRVVTKYNNPSKGEKGEIRIDNTVGATVYLKVTRMNNESSGSFAIGYTNQYAVKGAFDSTPLTDNQWMNDIITSNSELWYSFSASNWYTYRVWCNDKVNGDGTKTASVHVTAYKYDGTEIFNSAGWDSPGIISYSGYVYLKVTPMNSGGTGTFGIVYSSNNSTRP